MNDRCHPFFWHIGWGKSSDILSPRYRKIHALTAIPSRPPLGTIHALEITRSVLQRQYPSFPIIPYLRRCLKLLSQAFAKKRKNRTHIPLRSHQRPLLPSFTWNHKQEKKAKATPRKTHLIRSSLLHSSNRNRLQTSNKPSVMAINFIFRLLPAQVDIRRIRNRYIISTVHGGVVDRLMFAHEDVSDSRG